MRSRVLETVVGRGTYLDMSVMGWPAWPRKRVGVDGVEGEDRVKKAGFVAGWRGWVFCVLLGFFAVGVVLEVLGVGGAAYARE